MSVLFTLLVLTSSLTFIYCFDCSLIKPNGTYNEVSIYSRLDDKQNNEYWNKNSDGKEWQMSIELTTGGQINAFDGSVRDVKPSDLYTRLIDSNPLTGFQCEVMSATKQISDPNQRYRAFKCWLLSDPNVPIMQDSILSTENSVLFGPYKEPSLVREIEPSDRQYRRFFWLAPKMSSLHCDEYKKIVDDPNYKVNMDFCDNSFANHLSDALYTRLDTSFKLFSDNESESQVLWSNINGCPRYRIQKSRTELSSECKDWHSFKPAFNMLLIVGMVVLVGLPFKKTPKAKPKPPGKKLGTERNKKYGIVLIDRERIFVGDSSMENPDVVNYDTGNDMNSKINMLKEAMRVRCLASQVSGIFIRGTLCPNFNHFKVIVRNFGLPHDFAPVLRCASVQNILMNITRWRQWRDHCLRNPIPAPI